MTSQTTVIPSRAKIARMTAGTCGGSTYQQARAKVWSAIRDRYEHVSITYGHDAAVRELAAAIEWAEVLDRNVPARNGSHLEMSYFANQAPRRDPMTDTRSFALGHTPSGSKTHLINLGAGTDRVALCGRLVSLGGSAYTPISPAHATCAQCKRTMLDYHRSLRWERMLPEDPEPVEAAA